MLALQGPASRDILLNLLEWGSLPEPRRNELSVAGIAGAPVLIGRTGYTGEPLCFELFVDTEHASGLWRLLVQAGAAPAGLGARDTLRLEAALPLYGNELGADPEGHEIPIMSSPLAAFAVSFSPVKGEFVGRAALVRQHAAYRRLLARDYGLMADLPRMTRAVAVTGRGVARAGSRVFKAGRPVGWVTSGTMVPFWKIEGEGLDSRLTDGYGLRSICLALMDSDLVEDDELAIDIRGRSVQAIVVPYHLRSDAPPYARPIVHQFQPAKPPAPAADRPAAAHRLLQKTIENTLWRQRQCINLIPSEMPTSPLVRLLSVMDPAFRYAEHRTLEAFYDADVFYYQGTAFIEEVERLLEAELCHYLGSTEVETRLVSGQMANAAVFSALVEYLNRGNSKQEPRRIRMVMNNHIGKGGHLSAQPMGALKDFVAIDPRTDRPAVVNFPVLPDNHYRIDVARTCELIAQHRPELIIFGKSMVLHREPVAEVRRFLDEQGLDDRGDVRHGARARVGGASLPAAVRGRRRYRDRLHPQDFLRYPTRRGGYPLRRARGPLRLVGGRAPQDLPRLGVQPSPGHHARSAPGRLRDEPLPRRVPDRRAGQRQGLRPRAGRRRPGCGRRPRHRLHRDPPSHSGRGVRARTGDRPAASRTNNIICNYQAGPDEEGFTAAGALRLGVAEMTRFGMQPADFQELAGLLAEAILRDGAVKEQVVGLRSRFLELQFCFRETDYEQVADELQRSLLPRRPEC